ncbi:MAG: Holliday junction branch migration DNA helicase RuvB [Planctomycetota bacterium]|nr:MAG: Holliday junction branch migration DNA helicase RuvB [Planctomycetota bacterium]
MDKKDSSKPQDSRDSIFSEKPSHQEACWEQSLRPASLKEFLGQPRVVENLKIYIQAAKQRKEGLDHILFSGCPGLGKTTLAFLIAKEMGVQITATSGPVLAKPGDLAGILTSLKEGDILFIDEIHRLKTIVEEFLYTAMEDFAIDIMLDQGPGARSIRLKLPRFTLIGATTREGLLSSPFRARFGVLEKLELYPPEILEKIILRTARILNIGIDGEAAKILARRSRGTPRIANRIVRRIRDLAEVSPEKKITVEIAEKGLSMLGIDEEGLEMMDRKILETIITHGGGPVGLKTIAVSVGEEERTIEDVYEPYLIQQGFISKTPRGRKVLPKSYKHLGRDSNAHQQRLF